MVTTCTMGEFCIITQISHIFQKYFDGFYGKFEIDGNLSFDGRVEALFNIAYFQFFPSVSLHPHCPGKLVYQN